jgi:hypothetical protein
VKLRTASMSAKCAAAGRSAFIRKGACWLNLQAGWWRTFRRQALD